MKTLLALALLIPLYAQADITGRVVSVADGDTITVLDANNEQHKIRLAEIDAPEKAQAFGHRSKQALSDLVYNKEVKVVDQGRDKYRRTIGRVYQGDVDINAQQVAQGMAWVYRKYSKDPNLLALEAEPTPPWEWRHSKKY